MARPILTQPEGGPALVAYQVLTVLASLRLTVVLFSQSMLLIFFGTLAQMDRGIFTILHDYFRTGLAWVPFELFFRFGQVFFGVPQTWHIPGSFPFPGGWLLGTLLLVNILAAHAVRFRMSWKRSGVLILHAGVFKEREGGSPLGKPEMARAFEAALKRAGKPVEATYYEYGGHNSFFSDARQRDDEVRRMVAFYQRHLRP